MGTDTYIFWSSILIVCTDEFLLVLLAFPLLNLFQGNTHKTVPPFLFITLYYI